MSQELQEGIALAIVLSTTSMAAFRLWKRLTGKVPRSGVYYGCNAACSSTDRSPEAARDADRVGKCVQYRAPED